jgi:hypothetical protein
VATGSGTRVVADCQPSTPDQRGEQGWGKMGAGSISEEDG